ncbi:phage distal tail protein [Dactylosporangium salmoneum]|uniref:Siphovirus-type tail component C-terminal domain-containing protein n=1 Tax=Dactylosporangium salmoneum TaxID=53361 RepID=A0ABN3G9M8_9ACTN
MALPALYRPNTSTYTQFVGVAIDGWKAPGLDDYGCEWILETFEGWSGTPDLRVGGQDRPLDHGQFDQPSYLGSRVVTMQGTTICPTQTAALLASDIVSSICSDPSQLYLLQVAEPSGIVRRANVRLNTPTKVSDLIDGTIRWQIQVKAPDPRRYDDNETVIVLTPPTGASGGITVPFTVPFTISTTGLGSSTATAVNNGTFATRPVVTLAGPLVDPQIAHLGVGRSLSLTITLAAGDVLVVDFDKRTVTLNGSASRSNTLTDTAAWWELAPGGNDLMLTAGGGSGTATIRYRSALL